MTEETKPETIGDITREMRRMMPNACDDWANRIDRVALPQPDTLRDWFAGMALGECTREAINTHGMTAQIAARVAYEMADAMLVERAKGGGA